MRDYSQYTATPTKTKNRNHAGYNNANSSNSNNSKNVTPSPASSAASFPNFYSYPNSSSSSHQPWKNYNYSNNSSKAKKKDAPSTASTAAVTQSTHQEPQPPQEQEQQPSQEERSRTVQEAYHNNSSSSNASHEAQTHSQSQQQQSQQHSQQLQHSQKPSQQQQVQKQRLSPLKAASPQPSSKSPQPSPRSTKSPQLSPQRFFHSTSPSPTPSPSSNHHHNHNHSLAHADALSLKRDGPEATIASLRKELEEAKARDETDKDHLIKSDATILELRSSVRQLKRQLEKVDGEARQKHQELVAAKEQLQQLKQQQQQQKQQQQNSSTPTTDDTSRSSEHAMAREERVGELQVQLDRAHAQILTADMVRKELEDTLEAEQYTWELRVQDQERTIVELQQEIGVLAEDLELCRHQWKQADEEWAKKVAELEAELAQYQRSGPGHNGNTNTNTNHNSQEVEELHEKMRQLEEERNELQTCLDEALQELEAVDAELGNHTPQELQQLRQENQRLQQVVQKQRDMQQQQQQQQHLQPGDHDIDTLEGLQHLYRWLLERSADGEEKKTDSMPQTSPELLDAIHHVLESMPAWDGNARNTANANANANNNDNLAQTVVELEAQLSVYRGDLQAREESSAELRASLKEAVALIKPLQDAVDKADQQKADLQQEVDRLRSDHDLETSELQEELQNAERKLRMKEQQCERLQQDVERLKSELDDARELAQARQKMYGLSPSAAAAAATAQATTPSQQPPTQELSSLSKARADLKAKREQENTLRNLLRDAQNRFHSLNQQNQSVEAMNQQLQGKLRDAEEQRSRSAGSMEGLEVDVVSVTHQNQQELEEQIAQLRRAVDDKEAELNDLRQQAKQPSEELTQKVHMLEVELNKTQEELKKRQQSEKVLNNSLKEALGLLKPLQSHLEEAEEENKELSQELRKLRRKLNAMGRKCRGWVPLLLLLPAKVSPMPNLLRVSRLPTVNMLVATKRSSEKSKNSKRRFGSWSKRIPSYTMLWTKCLV